MDSSREMFDQAHDVQIEAVLYLVGYCLVAPMAMAAAAAAATVNVERTQGACYAAHAAMHNPPR